MWIGDWEVGLLSACFCHAVQTLSDKCHCFALPTRIFFHFSVYFGMPQGRQTIPGYLAIVKTLFRTLYDFRAENASNAL